MKTIIISLLLRSLKCATPGLIEGLKNMVLDFEAKARETPNPFDDMLADILKGIVGIHD